jgi:integrase
MLDPYFVVRRGNPPLTEITPADVLACRKLVCGADGARRRGRWNKAFSRGFEMFEYARALERVDRNPWIAMVHRFHEVPRGAPPLAIGAAQLDAIRAAADQHEDPRVAVVVLLAAFGGLRLDEMTHLRMQDLTITDTLVDVRVATDFPCGCRQCAKDGGRHLTKNGTERFVPFVPAHGARLTAHVERLRAAGLTGPETWLLACLRREARSKARPGHIANRETLAFRVENLVARTLGLPPVEVAHRRGGKRKDSYENPRTEHRLPKGQRVHVLRHAARTRFSHLGLPSETIDLIMGHRLAGMRAVYTHQDRVATFRALCEMASRAVCGDAAARSA